MSRLRIGIIGLGGAGRAHVRRFRRNRHVSEVVGFDPRTTALPSLLLCPTLDALLDGVDAASICTPDDTHLHYIKACVDRGKHVLVEKPMVASAREAEELGPVLVARPDVKFAVHHQMRFVPAFEKAAELIRENRLGRLFYMEANYWHDMRARNTRFDDWRVRGAGQSVIFGGACHPLDLLLHLAPGTLRHHTTFLSKNGYSDYPGPYTSATTLLQFDDGLTAKCHTNNCAVFPQFNNLVVLGDEGSFIDGVLYRDGRFTAASRFVETGGPLSVFRRLAGAWPAAALLKALPRLPLFRGNPFSVYSHDRACQTIIDNFVDAVRNDGPVLVGYDDGCRVIRLCEQVEAEGLRSGISGEPARAAVPAE